MKTKENIEKAASSKTLRKATSAVAKHLNVDPDHSKYPSDDFEAISELIPEKIQQEALKWYQMGIKRGFNKATDMMLDKKFYIKGSTLYGPKKIEFKVRTKFKGKKWTSRKVKFDSEDIGFD